MIARYLVAIVSIVLPLLAAPLRVLNDDSIGLESTAGTCVKGDCVEGQGQMNFKADIRYEGNWRAGAPHGLGSVSTSSKKLYDGIWREGRFWGRCISGTCENGIGAIELTGCIVKIVDARFQSSKICGGTEIYSGFFKNYKKHGRGFISGVTRIETGDYVDDKLSGYCEFMTLHGYSYRGACLNNNLTGKGRLIFGIGGGRYKTYKSFDGQLKDGQPRVGTLTLTDGRIFVGTWLPAEGRIRGTITHKGQTMKGEWDEDILDTAPK